MKVFTLILNLCLLGVFVSSIIIPGGQKSIAFHLKPLFIAPADTNLPALETHAITERRKVTWKSPTGENNELVREIMAGLVVALATIPTSISYSTVVGINPIIGIWNSAIVGLLVTVVGGAPGK